jgi:tRNA 2-thiocytidine biosynthesis protein TtcA
MADRLLRRLRASEIVRKLAAKAVFERRLINDGDRILIARSGGKDSTVLAWVLSELKPMVKKKNYELAALHISSDFCSCCKKQSFPKSLHPGTFFLRIFLYLSSDV